MALPCRLGSSHSSSSRYKFSGFPFHLLHHQFTVENTVYNLFVKMSLRVLALVSSLLLVSASIASATGGNRSDLKTCMQTCRHQSPSDESELQICKSFCEGYYGTPQQRLQRCETDCEYRAESQKSACRRECADQYREETEETEGGGAAEQQHERQQEESPYVFEDKHFDGIQTEHGRFRILQEFTQRSELLKSIENYRVIIVEINPQTFIVPNHLDADSLYFVSKGQGTINLVHDYRRESFRIKSGDVFRVPAGLTVYMINSGDNEKLVIAKVVRPVNIPGHVEAFYATGGEWPESFYKAFSNDILEAALNVNREKIGRLLSQQHKGQIIKASPEQIRELSRQEEGSSWSFGGKSKGAINLFEQGRSHMNSYGQLYEIDPSEHSQLQDLNIAISFTNITRGGMQSPFYNSRATNIMVVLDGQGYFEMACPHLSSSGESGSSQEQGQHTGGLVYQRVSARLKPGVVVVIPASHPIVTVASNTQNLQAIYFEINANNNEKIQLAGRSNMINRLERVAKELAFNAPSREVDEVFKSQYGEYFFQGPSQQTQPGRADA